MIMEKSEEMIPQEVISVNKKINKYKLSLISYEFEQFYINKRLDTSVSDFEIKEYYKNHLDDFVLNDYVVKCMYMKIPKMSKFYKVARKNYHMKDEQMVDQMIKISQNDNVLYYNPVEWIFFDDLLKEIPFLKIIQVEFIQKRKKQFWNTMIIFIL